MILSLPDLALDCCWETVTRIFLGEITRFKGSVLLAEGPLCCARA